MQTKYREIFKRDKTMTVYRLKTGTSKLFIREVLILKQMSPHPNIVKLVEVVNKPVLEAAVETGQPQ